MIGELPGHPGLEVDVLGIEEVPGDLHPVGVEPGPQAFMAQDEVAQCPGQRIAIEITVDVGP